MSTPDAADPERLSSEGYWDGLYARTTKPMWGLVGKGSPLVGLLRRALGEERMRALLQSYALTVVEDDVLGPQLAELAGGSMVEIGSAPGKRLLRLHEKFGLEPYGVEYTELGVAANRRLFEAAGFDPDRVIHADMFDESFRAEHRERFDLVYSAGLIEHFDEPRAAVEAHTHLLKPGGVLMIMIPNMTGLNHLLVRFFNPSGIALHNLSIMNLAAFKELFRGLGLEERHLDNTGVFSMRVRTTDSKSWKRRLLWGLWALGGCLDLVLLTVMRRRRLEVGALSPYLVYVGVKPRVDGA